MSSIFCAYQVRLCLVVNYFQLASQSVLLDVDVFGFSNCVFRPSHFLRMLHHCLCILKLNQTDTQLIGKAPLPWVENVRNQVLTLGICNISVILSEFNLLALHISPVYPGPHWQPVNSVHRMNCSHPLLRNEHLPPQSCPNRFLPQPNRENTSILQTSK